MEILDITQFNSIVTALKQNKAVIIPTDTVWGVIAINQDVIYQVKERPLSKKLSVFISKLDQANLPQVFKEVITNYVPGGLSFICKDVSYRIPDSDLIIRLVDELGPLYQSSANISGKIPITSLQEATRVFENKKDLVIVRPPDGWTYSNVSSTIINLDTMQVVRKGIVDGQKIIDQLKKGIK